MTEFFLPLHPKVIHFPIALFICAFLFQSAGLLSRRPTWCSAAWTMYVFAVLVTPLVVLSGLWEANRLHLHHPIVDRHRVLALSTMGISAICFLLMGLVKKYKAQPGWIIAGLMAIVVVLVVWTAHFGGMIEG